MSNIKKRTGVIAAAMVVVLFSAVAAYAYWTTTGSGTGTAATGTSNPIVANQDDLANPLAPGVAAQTLSGDFTNETTATVYVTTVTASIASVTQANGAVGGCTAADYTLTNAVMDVNANVAVGANVGNWGAPGDAATIQFNNTGANQDGCKLATVNLAYAIA